MRTNTKITAPQATTHEGAAAYPHTTAVQQLRRSVLSCMLFEGEFYESGQSIADRIFTLAKSVDPSVLAALAVEARTVFNLRHAPLLLCVALAACGKGKLVGDTIATTIQRADELAEFLSLYWKQNARPDGKRPPLSKQVKRGLAMAFGKFSEYQLAKYNRDHAIKLRDVVFMVHPKASTTKGDVLDTGAAAGIETPALSKGRYKRGPVRRHPESLNAKLIEGTLATPDTWEVELSAGKDKKATFERLLSEGKLGYLALLRNLRNMAQAGVSQSLVAGAILARNGAQRVLPFRYIAAARAAPQFEPMLDAALQTAIADMPVLPGKTVVLVDVSGSMDSSLSSKSDLTRLDAAAALASIIPAESLRVVTFSDKVIEVPPRKGMAGVDAIRKSQVHSGTELYKAVAWVNKNIPYDRIIVITDEQAAQGASIAPLGKLAYMINVASYQHGIGYGKWTHIDGFSETVLRFIHENEKLATES